MRLLMRREPTEKNFEARGPIQTGEKSYSKAGLKGQGQVVGVADSGLNDLSCFFYDGDLQKTVVTNRSGILEVI